MVMLTNLADVLRSGGLTVIETPGWKTRGWAGRQFAGSPKGVLWHHTATTSARAYKTGAPTLNMCIGGRRDLPGPLCNIVFGRAGEVYVTAAGWANHAGRGGPRGSVPRDQGNPWLIGIEMESSGVAPWDWTADQIRVMPYLGAALEKAYLMDQPAADRLQIAHFEWSSMGKIDPAGLPGGIDGLRSAINHVLASGTHSWSYANPTGAPARAAATKPATPTKAATPAPTTTKEWSDMATEAQFREIVREEIFAAIETLTAEKDSRSKRLMGRFRTATNNAVSAIKIPAQGSAKGEQTFIEFLRWQRHNRARSEAADKAIAAALGEGRLKSIVSEAVAASQADTVTVVSDARITRQVPADQIQEVQA